MFSDLLNNKKFMFLKAEHRVVPGAISFKFEKNRGKTSMVHVLRPTESVKRCVGALALGVCFPTVPLQGIEKKKLFLPTYTSWKLIGFDTNILARKQDTFVTKQHHLSHHIWALLQSGYQDNCRSDNCQLGQLPTRTIANRTTANKKIARHLPTL